MPEHAPSIMVEAAAFTGVICAPPMKRALFFNDCSSAASACENQMYTNNTNGITLAAVVMIPNINPGIPEYNLHSVVFLTCNSDKREEFLPQEL